MTDGLYVAAKPDFISSLVILNYASQLGLPNIIPLDELHVTIMYSKKLPTTPYPTINQDFAAIAKAYDLVYIGNAIALMLISPFLRIRNTLAIACGMRSDFIGYTPHMSLFYDVPKNLILAEFPKPNFEIILETEYTEPLKG